MLAGNGESDRPLPGLEEILVNLFLPLLVDRRIRPHHTMPRLRGEASVVVEAEATGTDPGVGVRLWASETETSSIREVVQERAGETVTSTVDVRPQAMSSARIDTIAETTIEAENVKSEPETNGSTTFGRGNSHRPRAPLEPLRRQHPRRPRQLPIALQKPTSMSARGLHLEPLLRAPRVTAVGMERRQTILLHVSKYLAAMSLRPRSNLLLRRLTTVRRRRSPLRQRKSPRRPNRNLPKLNRRPLLLHLSSLPVHQKRRGQRPQVV